MRCCGGQDIPLDISHYHIKRKWQLVTGYSENADDLGLGAILFGVRNGSILTIDPVNSSGWCIESRLRVSSQEGKWPLPIDTS